MISKKCGKINNHRGKIFVRSLVFGSIICGGILLLSFLKLESVPPLWWDEGWTLSVARNWVELGHYGRLLNGELHSARLSGHFPVVASIALSFKVFGIGIWQARLPGVLYMLGAILCLLYLAKEIYNPAVALGSLFVLLFMTIASETHPILNGRQALGELPALFFLLGGYCFLMLAMRRSIIYLVPVVLFWGIAIRTKAQVQPFWIVSIVVPLGFVLVKKWWREGVILLLAGIGAWLVEDWLGILQGYILAGHTVAGESIQGLYDVTAIVPNIGVRFKAGRKVLIAGFPTLAGLGYATWRTIKQTKRAECKDTGIIIQTAILALSFSWFCWYVLSANFWGRYLFPVVFIGSIFVAKLLYDLTYGFNVKKTVKHASSLILRRETGMKSLGAFFGIILMSAAMALTVYSLTVYSLTVANKDSSGSAVEQVANYLNANTPVGALIETYDSELFFFLERAYHYPPDQVWAELVRRRDIDPDTPVNYDPMQADPDYLVIGPFSRIWRVYEEVLDNGEFQRVNIMAPYEIFVRVRE